MSKLSQMMQLVNTKAPAWSRSWLFSTAFNLYVEWSGTTLPYQPRYSNVKYAGTSGIKIEELTAEQSTVSIVNRRRTQNHIGGVHAAAMALLAETATGILIGVNVPDDKLPLIQSLKVDYKRRTQGAMRAVATLTEEQRALMQSQPKGSVLVDVVVTDESGQSPIECEMLWAWVPKRRTPKPDASSSN